MKKFNLSLFVLQLIALKLGAFAAIFTAVNIYGAITNLLNL